MQQTNSGTFVKPTMEIMRDIILKENARCTNDVTSGRKNTIRTCALIERFTSPAAHSDLLHNFKALFILIAFGYLLIVDDQHGCRRKKRTEEDSRE